MREFKFNIDDWTGGNTLGNDIGDAIGSTVNIKLFSIRTHPTKEYSFINNGIIEITVDWGDGTVEDLIFGCNKIVKLNHCLVCYITHVV